ncbi:MAG: heavy metal sensor histidine kinase [Betaproteobacteria bacterium]|nr:heavy metal sensor histidine kinase [Betaproteobacteria bacterium]
MNALSLTARISLLFAAAAAAVLLLVGVFVARATERHFVEMDYHELGGKLDLVRNLLAQDGDLTRRLDDALVGHHGLVLALAAADGAVLYASADLADPRALLAQAPGRALWRVEGQALRGLLVRVERADNPRRSPAAPGDGSHAAYAGSPGAAGLLQDYTVAIGLDISHHEEFMGRFRQGLGLAMGLAALAAAALGWAATRTGLTPLRRVTALAAGLSASRLGERLPQARAPAEIETLAAAFNAMLVRLEDGFRRLSEFSSDIAHELRTPLSNLMTQTQVALAHPRTPEEYRETLYSTLEECERLARMVTDMLFLAQADNGLIVPNREEVALAAEVDDLFEFFEPLASEAGVALVRQGAARVTGDRLMLRRALANLLANAIRHTPRGGAVGVVLEQGEGVRVAVENPGEAIDPVHLPHLFERFYRADPARQRSSEGVGLGLAITRSSVEAHGGVITAASADGVTRFEIRLG